jgi:hypothetical protein
MTQTTAPAPAIGTCLWAGHTFRVDTKPTASLTPCPTCEPVDMGGFLQRSFVKWAKVTARVTRTECNDECRSAKGSRCACECGGDNHGAAWGMDR